MDRGDIYFVDLDPTLGHEQRGHRPVLILSPAAFNRLGVQLVAPITTGGAFARHRGFAVPVQAGRIDGVVLCNQIKTIDLAARQGRRVAQASDEVIEEVLARVSTLLQ